MSRKRLILGEISPYSSPQQRHVIWAEHRSSASYADQSKLLGIQMTREVEFSTTKPASDRIYHITEEDLHLVLSRLPEDAYSRLRRIHFNDQSRGARILGYVNRGRREIALCALPPRVSLTRFLTKGLSPRQFGARRGTQWPKLAIRRFLLYDVFLHELGHLQVVYEQPEKGQRKFALEKKAQEFADSWRKRLWARPFDHPDPAHNPPSTEELSRLDDG